MQWLSLVLPRLLQAPGHWSSKLPYTASQKDDRNKVLDTRDVELTARMQPTLHKCQCWCDGIMQAVDVSKETAKSSNTQCLHALAKSQVVQAKVCMHGLPEFACAACVTAWTACELTVVAAPSSHPSKRENSAAFP